MFILIPITIFSGWTIYSTIDKLLGYPVNDVIVEDSFYLYHIDDPLGDYIFVWLVKPGELRPKAIMVKNSKSNKESLEKAQEKKEQGVPQMMKPAGDQEGKGQTAGGEFELYDFQNTGDDVIKEQQRERESGPRPLPGRDTSPAVHPTDEVRRTPTGFEYQGVPLEDSTETPETYGLVKELRNYGGK